MVPIESLGPVPADDTKVPHVVVKVPDLGAVILRLSEAVVRFSVSVTPSVGVFLPFDMVLSLFSLCFSQRMFLANVFSCSLLFSCSFLLFLSWLF